MALRAAFVRLAPALTLALLGLATAAIFVAAGPTLGYDYLAYDAAARRLLAGEPLYDMSFAAAGGFGLFYYPPTFIVVVLPFAALLPAPAATFAWIAALMAAFLVGVAALPVARPVRVAVVAIAATAWPFLYAVKLGQVGPLLFALFALAWRSARSEPVAGIAAALGAAVKVQPGILLGWALVTRRWRAVAIGIGVLAGLSLLVTALAGPGTWADFLTLLGRVADPITTPKNLTPGAIAYRAGLSRELATLVQWAFLAAVATATVVIWLRAPAPEAIVATAVASQLLSPIIWEHYAVLLLLPVAMLLERRLWWAAALLPALWIPIDALYPFALVIGLVAPVLGNRRRGSLAALPRS